ncbi:transposase [Butyrivibrio sp. MB2005]|uniref:transposase n=1 Tax=Butyrivibrio sp. MB2005 TaxID=1280678 RepID=UPI0018C914AA|nr:transposase [Butyrivibrio sp. MB2005]
MYSRGVKERKVNHPILQDNYSLIIILKQRRWRCTNPECNYNISENFKFVNKRRRTSNATDMLIVSAYRDLMETSVSISKRFHVSDTYAHEVFNRYVKLDRLPLTDSISIDEVCLDIDEHCRYALVIQDFHTGDPIDLLRSRRNNVTEPYFASIPMEERAAVKYLISDMYKPYIAYVLKCLLTVDNNKRNKKSFCQIINILEYEQDRFLRIPFNKNFKTIPTPIVKTIRKGSYGLLPQLPLNTYTHHFIE